MDMPPPRTLKQIQSLSGKLEALNRFLSKSAEHSLPFLDTLKKCTNKKDFRWTEAAEAAFLEMKKLVSGLPTLTTPKKGETLMMYLAAANEAVSAILLTERDGRKMSIHYVSRSLQGEETNYAPMEKLALDLVHAARRLRRLAKWAVELGAYGITYVPRVTVKGQVLADFLADTPTVINATPDVASTPRIEDIPESSNSRENLTLGLRAWRLYTDGASNNEGSGVGLILIAPNDVKDIHAFVDSKLVASQVEGSYKAKGERMKKYREKVLELAGACNRFQITHIPKVENKKADALSKLVAVRFDHLSKEVLVEILNKCSVEEQEVNMVVEEEGPNWMTSIRNYLEKGILPEDPIDARTLMEKIGNYTIEDGVRYRKSYLVPLMRDARKLTRACNDCQAHAFVPRLPKADMISVTSAWPFMKFRIPATIITDNGTQFGNGVVERANKSLLRGIKTRLEKGGSAWAEEMPNKLRLNLDLLEERREIAAIREARYNQQVEKYYNKKVRHVQFKVGEFVLRKNEGSRAANT
ncbi:reverse transcriptase domain-containing protein [Tanacetum coccineum]|uniref:Reverse transcriptase domain-containing protein n=1 Tax=Tanacetum coccineum TaxID=301880 RepID=A0ABQ5H0M4_9ASTR